MVWHSSQIGTAWGPPRVYRYRPASVGSTMHRTNQRPYAAQRTAPPRFIVVPRKRYLGKAQVYDMSDELEQFEEAVDDAAVRLVHARPRSRSLAAAFERNWRNRAEKFITGPR